MRRLISYIFCIYIYILLLLKKGFKLRRDPVVLKNPAGEMQTAQKILPGKVMIRNFRDGLIQVAGLKWKHYSMSWHLSLEVGGWLGAQGWAASKH